MRVVTLLITLSVLYVNSTAQSNFSIKNQISSYFTGKGVSAQNVADIKITDRYIDKSNNLEYVYFMQKYEKLPVFNSLSSVVLREDKVVHSTNRLKSLQNTSGTNHTMVWREALTNAFIAANRFEEIPLTYKYTTGDPNTAYVSADGFEEPIKLAKGYYEIDDKLHPVWLTVFTSLDASEYWHVYIDASNGQVLDKSDLVINCQFDHLNENGHDKSCYTLPETQTVHSTEGVQANASYNAFPIKIESPNHGNRVISTDPHDTIASPYGWHDINGVDGADFTYTRGNNVLAQEDRNGNNGNGMRVDGGASLTFDAPFDKTQSADNFVEASIVNLFYWNNLMHDVWYHYGFDEPAGNFQQNNYGKGGLGNDYVLADAQDGTGTNNANFAPRPEGSTSRMQMYLWRSGGAGSSDLFKVEAPSSIEGKYDAAQAGFGPRLTKTPITREIVLVDDGSTDPSEGCNTLSNASQINGKIAVIDRGTCPFVQKVQNAQSAGAVGVIIVSNTNSPFTMGGSSAGISIPSIMVGSSTGATLKGAMGNGTVTASLYDSSNVGVFYFDSDFDNGVIAHEYTHGISTRLTGGPSDVSCLRNQEQMGEGWSDFLSLIMTQQPGDKGEDKRGIGTYVRGQNTNGGGIRPYPYSTNTTINPVTYDDIKLSQFTVPHGVGSVWCAMLWDLHWAFIDRYGYDPDLYHGTGGNNMMMHLVMDGLKLQPCGPGFVDGRDAILKADSLRYGGRNSGMIWRVFAARGLGYSASQGSPASKSDGTEAFDVPPFIQDYVFFKEIIGNNTTVNAGDEVTYELTLINQTDDALDSIRITDILDTPAEYVVGTESCNISHNGQMFELLVPSVPANDTFRCTYKVVVPKGNGGQELWYDDMESDTMGWMDSTDLGNRSWSRTTLWRSSGIWSWYIPDEGNQSDHWLYRKFDLDTLGNPHLTFNHFYNTEADWDGAVVEILQNGSWIDLGSQMILNGYNSKIQPNPASRIQNRNAFTGRSEDYVTTIMDLTPYAGQEVTIRFRFVSDGLQGGVGWFIDDVRLWENYTLINNSAVVEIPGLESKRDAKAFEVIYVAAPDTIPTDTIIVINEDLRVYPNPFTSKLMVQRGSKDEGFIEASIHTAIGQKVWEGTIPYNEVFTIQTGHLAVGMYILRLVDGEEISELKLIKQSN